jgi:hypothetical protein
MDYENRDELIIKKYQQDEKTMIQLYVQWCLNHGIDPVSLYQQAYPGQARNEVLVQEVEEAGREGMEISNEAILEILQMFGNDDLAFAVSEEIQKLHKK